MKRRFFPLMVAACAAVFSFTGLTGCGGGENADGCVYTAVVRGQVQYSVDIKAAMVINFEGCYPTNQSANTCRLTNVTVSDQGGTRSAPVVVNMILTNPVINDKGHMIGGTAVISMSMSEMEDAGIGGVVEAFTGEDLDGNNNVGDDDANPDAAGVQGAIVLTVDFTADMTPGKGSGTCWVGLPPADPDAEDAVLPTEAKFTVQTPGT